MKVHRGLFGSNRVNSVKKILSVHHIAQLTGIGHAAYRSGSFVCKVPQ